MVKRVKSLQYLVCPGCGHDLRGCPLVNEGKVITHPAKAELIDVVLCPECSEFHKVKELPGIWEMPIG